MASGATGATVIFPSREALKSAIFPLQIEDVEARIAAARSSFNLQFQFASSILPEKIIPLRNHGIKHLLGTELCKTKMLTVYYPEEPRVPHHLCIARNRMVAGIENESDEENAELFALINKIAEIYKTIQIHGFVIAQYDRPQAGHDGRYVVEIIPHLPGFSGVKNIADKVGSNLHVLFRSANLTPTQYYIPKQEIKEQAAFWRDAFTKEHPPLSLEDSKITFPYKRFESHQPEAEAIMGHQVLELLEDLGGTVLNKDDFTPTMPTEVPEKPKEAISVKCHFCDTDGVIANQLVYEYEDPEGAGIYVLYNQRKSAIEGTTFLLVPKDHTETVYGLSARQTHNMHIVRKALVAVLKDKHPGCEVIVYTQNQPEVGQTVFHSHEQVVAVYPKTMPLTWTMMALYPTGNASAEEMLRCRTSFGELLKQKTLEVKVDEKSA